MGKIKYICDYCGKAFHEGQGFIFTFKSTKIYACRNRCASKILRYLIERIEPDIVSKAASEIKGYLEEKLEEKRRKYKFNQMRK